MTSIQTKTNPSLKRWGLLMGLLISGFSAKAQCFITSLGPPCVGEPIQFSCSTVGSSNYQWDFNGEGSNNVNCNPSFIFATPGVKTITLSLKLANGNTCSTTLVLAVKPKPIISVKRISNKVQCFANNSFCFLDSSRPGSPGGGKIKKIIYVFDDGTKYTFLGPGPRTFCHSFQDPAGGIYGMTIELEDSNGCISKQRMNAVAVVLPSMGLTFSSPQPQRCDSAMLCVTNNSTILLDSIKSFTWDWGDGQTTNGSKTTPTLWKSQVCHWFKTQGPNSGAFNTKLSVTSNAGCTETFTFNASATNLIINPVILADFDSVCASNPVIAFRLKDGPIIKAANPQYLYELPSIPSNRTLNWTGSHKFSGPGVYKINFSFTHQIPGCGRTISDTILVIGPQSIIEGTNNFIVDTLRYQCLIKDTVRFSNLSKFYHNDHNMWDDDSTYIDLTGFNKPLGHKFSGAGNMTSLKAIPQNRGNSHVTRMWDFDDEYCDRCTTDTRNGINIYANCRYSKDSLPKHWYTPWEEVYLKKFSSKPDLILTYSKDSGVYYKRNLWSDDSVAIVRDTVLYYGDNALANKTKDSIIYNSISKKIKVRKEYRGISRTDFTKPAKIYLEAGDTVYLDANDGFPPNRWIGPRYLNVQPGSSLIIKSKTDKAFYIISIDYIQDTIPLYLAGSGYKIWKKEKVGGFKTGDSVNTALHRQKFYSGSKVRCFNVKLTQKDVLHPMACASEVTASLSLQPPSAKKLRKSGIQCLGGDQDNFGITFILDETKPGCSRTWAEINFDTALNKKAWVPAIGKNLGPGVISMGGLPPVNPPYQVPITGYAINGPPGNLFSKQFTTDDIRDSINGYINVGLIIGNGIWKNGVYPKSCQDTVYYPKFARFPKLDNRFRIVKPAEGSEYTQICRKDSVRLSTMAWNRSTMQDVKTTSWSLTGANVGKYYNQFYVLSVDETYNRFAIVHKDTPYLVDKLTVVKHSKFDGKTSRLDSQEIRIAKVTKWHTEADISNVFDKVKMSLAASNIDISDLTPTQIAQQIWNGQGSIGKPYTGARGIIDTTGFGKQIIFSTIADQKQTLHYRDTSLVPIHKSKGANGNLYNAYTLVPQHSGYYVANFAINSNTPGTCPKISGTSKKVIVGFYSTMNYTDTILCHGQTVLTSPMFRYFEVYPEITFRLLDPVDYWRNRIGEAGNVNREGFTRTDLSKADDNINIPKTIFGGFPYSITGMDNKAGQILQLGGLAGGIYYSKDTGELYVIRTAASDSFGCRDTITQNLFTTAARADFSVTQTRPQCNTIVEFSDASYVIDPHKVKYGTPADKIIKWTIDWGDQSNNSVNSFFDNLPSNISHDYTISGKVWIKLKVETELGCVDYDSMEITIQGMETKFDTLIKKKYCIGEKASLKNLSSKYSQAYDPIWVWDFGDHTFDTQRDTIVAGNDTMSHRYKQAGKYNIILYGSLHKVPGGGSLGTRCSVAFPDTINGRQKMFTIEVIDCDTVGIHEVTLKNVKMYPNPAHNSMTLVSKEKVEIIITDAMGKTIKTFFNEGEQTIDLRNLSPGLYIVTTRNKEVVGKLIVE